MSNLVPEDIRGAIDTSTVSGSDIVVAIIVAVVTVVVAIIVSRIAQGWIERTGDESRAIAALQ